MAVLGYVGWMVFSLKKKFLECVLHGLALFRCKRICWQRGGKDKTWANEHTERCFKCINEGRYIKKEIIKEKVKHFRI
ncbi:hypothetical protein HYX00_00715 [Candidatus Woesearchaeota archaeon]|nr:hypothetical protein [Candidatus Woesearchaeota archaeon]